MDVEHLNIRGYEYDIVADEMTGATAQANGTSGSIPAPTIADREKFFKGDGTWDNPLSDLGLTIVNGKLCVMHESSMPVTLPTQVGSLTYNGSPQSPTWSSTAHLTVTGNTGTEAGSYTTTFTPQSGYTWSDTGDYSARQVAWTIGVRTIVIPTVSGSFDYDGTQKSATINHTEQTYYTTGGDTTATEAGTYTVTFTLNNTTSTKWSDNTTTQKSGTWSIGSETVTIPTYSGSMTYDGTEQTASFNNYDSSLMTVTGDKGTNAGDYTAVFELRDKDNNTWSDGTTEDKIVSWSIGKATFTSTVSISDYTYAGTKSTPSVSANPGNGAVTYYSRQTEDGTITDFDGVTSTTYDAGTRYLYAVIAATSNYESCVTAQISFTIEKADFTATVSISGYTYGGSKSTPSVSNNPGNGSVTYYGRSTSSGSATAWSSVTSTTYNAGTRYVYAVISATTNYNSYTTPNKSFTISKGTLSGITVNTYSGYSYGASSISTPTISSNPGSGTVTFYGRSTSSGSGTAWSNVTGTTYNAGTRYIYATITGMTNYNDFTTANRSYTISKGTLSGITVNSYAGYTYGASSIPTPTISSNPGSGTVTFYGRSTSSGSGTAWSSMTGTTFEAGTRYIYATITGMTNYNDFTTENRSYTIASGWTNRTITFNANGGSGSVPSTITFTSATDKHDITNDTPTKSGYTFKGWAISSSGTRFSYNQLDGATTTDSWTWETWCTKAGKSSSLTSFTFYAQWEEDVVATLAFSGAGVDYLTSVEVYGNPNGRIDTYTEQYHFLTGMKVYPGHTIIIFQDNTGDSRGWYYTKTNGTSVLVGRGDAVIFDVPESASGSAVLRLGSAKKASDVFTSTILDYGNPSSSGWVVSSSCYPQIY